MEGGGGGQCQGDHFVLYHDNDDDIVFYHNDDDLSIVYSDKIQFNCIDRLSVLVLDYTLPGQHLKFHIIE